MKNIFVISMHGTIMAPYEPILIFGRHVPPLAMLITKIRWSARTSTHIVEISKIFKVLNAFIHKRYKKNEQERQRTLIMGKQASQSNLNFSNEALSILERRYLLKDETGSLIETPEELLRRVAKNVSRADADYKVPKDQIKETEENFYQMMADF